MKRWTIVLAAMVALVLVADAATAQPPGGGGRRPGGADGDRQPGGPGGRGSGFRFPPSPMMSALDADKDGELSAKEIKNASDALKKLDKNNDGKVDRNELRPPRPTGRSRGGRPGEGSGRPGGGSGGRESFAERLMGFDKNGDEKISKDELPERMQRILERVDTNKDDALDKEELKKMAVQFGRGPGGGGGRGDRPTRPPRPE